MSDQQLAEIDRAIAGVVAWHGRRDRGPDAFDRGIGGIPWRVYDPTHMLHGSVVITVDILQFKFDGSFTRFFIHTVGEHGGGVSFRPQSLLHMGEFATQHSRDALLYAGVLPASVLDDEPGRMPPIAKSHLRKVV